MRALGMSRARERTRARAFPATRRSQLHISRLFNYAIDFTAQFSDLDTPLVCVPIAQVASGRA